MNRIHRTVWSKSRKALIVVSEIATSEGKGTQGGSVRAAGRRSRGAAPAVSGSANALGRLGHSLAVAGLVTALPFAHALPQNGQVSSGSATIVQGAGITKIAQTSQSATLNWSSFNVGQGERVVFAQPNASAIALNRIADTSASQILGSLSANGQVFLVNPNGILFGAGAQVNVGALVASTLDVGDSALSQSSKTFSGAATGRITNLGALHAAQGGYIALIGNQVSNQGSLQAPGGSVALAAGAQVTLQFVDNQLLGLTVDRNTLGNLVDNHQLIQADGGQVILSAGARDSVLAGVVNNSGRMQARTAQNVGGVITLSGGQVQQLGRLDVSAPGSGNAGSVRIDGAAVLDGGQIDASSAAGRGGEVALRAAGGLIQTAQARISADGAAQGGHIALQANKVVTSATLSAKGRSAGAQGGTLDVLATQQVALQGAQLDASGTGNATGGLIRIGGDFHGTNPGVSNAIRTLVDGASTLRTDGDSAQGGGKVVVWSDAKTAYLGAIAARGGEVEVSSRNVLQFAGDVKARQLLLDPKNITIQSGAATATNSYFADSAGLGLSLDPVTLQNLLASGTAVTLQANTDLIVASPITVAGSTGGKLTLQAGRSVLFNANVSTANGNLTAVANDSAAVTTQRDAGSGNLVIASGVTLNVGTGTATLAGQVFVNNSGATALQTTGAGRWTVWSTNPANDTRGALAYSFKQYNASYGVTPLSQATGNGFVYTLAPTLTASLTGSVSKVYDANATASLSGVGSSTTGAIDGDTVTLSPLPANGTFSTKVAGTGKTISATGLSLASAVNGAAKVYGYALTNSATGVIGTITPASLVITGLMASNRTYDATTFATLSGIATVMALGSDSVTVASGAGMGTFVDKSAGANKPVTVSGYTLSGVDAANYAVVQPTGVSATISPAKTVLSGLAVLSRTYNTTTVAALAGTASVSVLGSDMVALVGTGTGTFADKAVGLNKAVTVSGYTLTGADASNYILVSPTGLSGTITRASLAVTGVTASNRTYDATKVERLGGTATVAPLGGDMASLMGTGIGTFANKLVGLNKPVTVSGYTLSGVDAGNYILVQPTGLSASITKANLAVTGITASNRTYDTTMVARLSGTATVAALGSDSVALSGTGTGTFADKSVGVNKPVTVSGYTLSGPDAANYAVVQPTGLSATITKASLAVAGVTSSSRAYDATTIATLKGPATVMTLGSDSVALLSLGTGTFVDKSVGINKAVTVSGDRQGGAGAANYSVVQPAGMSATISAAAQEENSAAGTVNRR